MNRVKLAYEGEMVDADEMEFKVQAEISGSYSVDDGAKIDLKHEVKNIYRLCDKRKEDGSPIYLVTGTATLKTTLPPEGAEPEHT